MKITFNVGFVAEKLIRYNSAKRLDKESAMVMINDLAKYNPSALCQVLQGEAHMTLFEGSKDYTCYVSVVRGLREIARTDTYTFQNTERIFQKEVDVYNYVDIIHIGGDFQREEPKENGTDYDLIYRIADVICRHNPEVIDYHAENGPMVFTCGKIHVFFDKSTRKAGVKGLTEEEIEALDYVLDFIHD